MAAIEITIAVTHVGVFVQKHAGEQFQGTHGDLKLPENCTISQAIRALIALADKNGMEIE